MSDTPDLGGIQWDQYNHQAMWDMVESADPRELMTRADELDALAKRMGENAEAAYRAMSKLMSSWSGGAADQSATVVQPLLNWASGAATTGSEIARRLGHYAQALDTAKQNMPKPVDYQQLDAVADGKAVTIGPLSMNQPELTAIANGDTATQAQAQTARDNAIKVMRQFEQDSASSYHGLPTFTRPPKVGSFPAPEPAPEPPPPGPIGPPLPPRQPPVTNPPTGTGPGTVDPGSANSSTNASDYAGPSGIGPDLGGADLGPGSIGAGGALSGIGAVGGGTIGVTGMTGLGAVSGVGDEEPMPATSALATEEAEQAGWRGFAPMGAPGRSRGDQDGEHRDRYAEEPNLIGELPAAFPPVLGL